MDAVAGVVMAGAAVVVIKHTVGAKVERSAGVDEAVLLASGSRVAAKAKSLLKQKSPLLNRCANQTDTRSEISPGHRQP